MTETDNPLAELLDLIGQPGAALDVRVNGRPLPVQYDVGFNGILLLLVVRELGTRRGGSVPVRLNYHVAKFAHFLCTRPALLSDFLDWRSDDALRPLDGWRAFPHGYMAHSPFDATLRFYSTAGLLAREGSNIVAEPSAASVPGGALARIDSLSLFSQQLVALRALKKPRVTQKSLGVA